MAAIVDTILVGNEELLRIVERYPEAVVTPIYSNKGIIRHFTITIPGENEHGWYDFLVRNQLAMSSRNFYSRVKGDSSFAEKIQRRIALPVATKGDEGPSI